MSSDPIVLISPVLPWPADQGSKRLQLESARALQRLGPVHWITRTIGDQSEAIERLSAEGFALSLDDSFRGRRLWQRAWRRLGIDVRAWRSGRPRELVYVASAGVRTRAREMVCRLPQAIWVGIYWSTWPALVVAPRGRRVLILADVESHAAALAAQTTGSGRELRRAQALRVAEREAYQAVDLLLCLTPEDQKRALDLVGSISGGGRRPAVGLWPATIPVPSRVPEPRLRQAGEPLRLLVYGNWRAPFNRDGLEDFLARIWPQLRKHPLCPVLRIVGSGLDRALADRARSLGAEVMGRVESLDQSLRWCDAVAIPLRYAGGLRYRLLEAMAAGRPTICSSVAAHGSGASSERHYLSADEPSAWALALDALGESDRAATLAADAHAFVRVRYGDQGLTQRLHETLRPLLRSEASEGD